MIIKHLQIRLFLCILLFHFTLEGKVYFLPGSCGGRLGDQLITYIKARWMAYQHPNSIFISTDFPSSNKLILSKEKDEAVPNKMKTFILEKPPQKFKKKARYEISFWFKDKNWGDFEEVSSWYNLISNDDFLSKLRQLIAPIDNLQLIHPPKKIRSVAVHVRKGGGFDWPLLTEKKPADQDSPHYSDVAWPTKFPPDSFYINQIIRLSEIFNDEPLYVYIFTDHTNPQHLIDIFKKRVNKPNIKYDCRQQGNHHTKNILEDLFSIPLYDYLIRGGSNFARVAQLIGNHKMVFYPTKCEWIDGIFYATEVKTHIKSDAFLVDLKKTKCIN